MRDRLVLFAKVPELGRAKTRLARDVGESAARDLAEAFVLDTLATAARVDGVQIAVAYSPTSGRDWFQERAPGALLVPQPETDFGSRMCRAMDAMFEDGAKRCVMIGMDTPQLEPARIESAFEALKESDVCLGPSEDGGYYLIGLRAPAPQLFEGVAWSTASVLTETHARAAESGLSVHDLDSEFDIDEAADLERLAAVLAARPDVGAATRDMCQRLE